MGLPTAIVANMTSEQLEAYTLHLRIEEITQKLKIDDVVPADGDRCVARFFSSGARLTFLPRSPSPPPQYDNHGRRVNTREYRYRKRLEDERHKLVEKAMKTIPNYHPPQDYRRPTKTQEKVYVPVNDYPEINFSMIANPLTLLTMFPFPFCHLTARVDAHGPKCRGGLVMPGRIYAAVALPHRPDTNAQLSY
jgi:splicing factor 1